MRTSGNQFKSSREDGRMNVSPHILFIEEGYRRSARAILHAAELGYEVSLIGSKPPRYCGHVLTSFRLADPYCPSLVAAAAKEVNQSRRICGVTSMMERLPAVASVAANLGLPGLGLPAAIISQNKALTRKLLRYGGMIQPRFEHLLCGDEPMRVSNAIDSIGFPCVLKPVGGAGGGGVFVLRDNADANSAVRAMRRMASEAKKTFGYFPGELIVEEYLGGQQYSLEGYCSNANVVLIGITQKMISNETIELGHLVPAPIDAECERKAWEFVKKICLILEIDQSMFHVEASYDDGEWRLIEVNARLGGGAIATDLVPLVYNVDMVDIMCRVACGRAIDARPHRSDIFASSTLFRGTSPGRVTGIHGIDEARSVDGVVDVIIEDAIEYVANIEYLAADDRVGAIIAWGETAIACVEAGRIAASKIVIETES